MKVYYAHCMAIYNTPQEDRDEATLASLGFTVVNPNSPEVESDLAIMRDNGATREETMLYFKKFATETDAIAFRGLPDGRIPSGVALEIKWFEEKNKPVIELPSRVHTRMISLDETREYLHEVGQR